VTDYATDPQTKLLIPRMDQEGLKRFVLDFCDGRILCDFQVPKDLLAIVFMPLALGALQPPEGTGPKRPVEPTPPPEPDKPDYPEQPMMMDEPVPDPQIDVLVKRIQDIDFQIKWEEGDSETLSKEQGNLQKELDALNSAYALDRERWDNRLDLFQKDLGKHARACRALDKKYQASLKAHQASLKAFEETTLAAYQKELETYQEERLLFFFSWGQDLGILYGKMSEAVGSRSINGFPFFGSVYMLHKDDWRRCKAAIDKELARRESFQV
jgi:hypothetical protein